MSARAFKIIIVLLSGSVFSVLLLQGYWIRNSYRQKKEMFETAVYSALEQVTNRIQERENIGTFKKSRLYTNKDTASRSSRKIKKKRNVRATAMQRNGSAITHAIIQSDDGSMSMSSQDGVTAIITTDKNGRRQDVVIETRERDDEEEMEKLLNKMLTEVAVIDTGELSPDSLQVLIRKALDNKGIFLPFDFSLRELRGDQKVLAQSQGFNDKNFFYEADLSAQKVFNTHRYLWLQLPGTNMMAAMKGNIVLSIIFSLIIIGAFYYTMRLILQQKKISEMKNDFVNNMTHELKTPIATISLAIDAMANPAVKNNEAVFGDYSRILKEENRKLNNHVERVLQLALLEKGALRLHKKKLDLAAIIRSCIAAHDLRISGRDAAVSFEAPAPVMIVGDEEHLCALINNLIDNALEYSGDPCRVYISLKEQDGIATVRVRDNGIGIPASHRDKIFEKFYRVQGGDLHDVKGFGLGLSYARSIASAHGGTITLAENQGGGSEFIITLKTDV